MGVQLQKCEDHDEFLTNQFIIEEFYYSNTSSSKSNEAAYLAKQGLLLEKSLLKVMPLPEILMKMIQTA